MKRLILIVQRILPASEAAVLGSYVSLCKFIVPVLGGVMSDNNIIFGV